MNATHEPTAAVRASVDRLYWNSDGTVEELTSRLGMSRQALYACVNPLPAGALCHECAHEMVFANRTSRNTRRARCTGCGATARVPGGAAAVEADDRSPRPVVSGGRRRGWRQWTAGPGWVAALGMVAAAAAMEVALRRA